MASREAMNMGDRSSNLITNLSSLISGITTQVTILDQTTARWGDRFESVIDKAKGIFGGGGGRGDSSSLIAPNPKFSSAPQVVPVSESGTSLVAQGPAVAPASGGRGAVNLTTFAAQSGGATLYQPEVGTPAMGSAGGGGGFGISGGGTGGGGGGAASNAQTTSGLGAVGSVINFMASAYNIGSNLVPSTADAIEAQLLQSRAAYYTQSTLGNVQSTQQNLARIAMLSGDNPQMDIMRAQIAAQSLGLTGGAGNLQNLMAGAAAASNLMPGLGMEGTIRVTGSMQQARSVNMLRGIGIQLRDPNTGQMKSPAEVIDLVWQKICRDYAQAYGAGKTPSLNEVQISLQPGNALDSMLNQYFGGDALEKQLVANGLIYKAQGGGSITALTAQTAPGVTAAAQAYTATAAAGQGLLTKAEAPAATGFGIAAGYLKNYYDNVGPHVVDTLSQMKATFDTVISAFGGSPASALLSGVATAASEAIKGLMNFFDPTSPNNPLANLIKGVIQLGTSVSGIGGALGQTVTGLPGMATGGPVSGNTPYIVGEKGPELFIPNANGTIISNDKLTGSGVGTYNNTYNFTVNVPNGSTQDVVAAIKRVLSDLERDKKVSES